MKRLFDLFLSLSMLILLSPVIILVGLLVKITSKGPIIYSSNRVGFNNRVFSMPKFRTMKVDTPTVATHLLTNPDAYITSVGSVLRKTSLDELPQLWSVFIGDMSLVGPRPALFSQANLIDARTKVEVHLLRPGITGWAQINGRDNLSIEQKVEFDRQYLQQKSLWFDLKIMLLTVVRVFRRDDVSH